MDGLLSPTGRMRRPHAVEADLGGARLAIQGDLWIVERFVDETAACSDPLNAVKTPKTTARVNTVLLRFLAFMSFSSRGEVDVA